MRVLDHLIASLDDDAPVRAIQFGAYWTAVASRRCGLASIPHAANDSDSSQAPEPGRYLNQSARQLSQMAISNRPLEASLGVAAVNSLVEVDLRQAQAINALDILMQHGRGKRVALVGHFPFVPRLRPAVGELWVFELQPREGDYPAEAAVDLVPQADVVAITSSTLINHTLDGLLALCPPGALVVLLGPSTPLSPVMFEHGVDVLSGVVVEDEQAVLQSIEHGASLKEMAGVRLVTLCKSDYSA